MPPFRSITSVMAAAIALLVPTAFTAFAYTAPASGANSVGSPQFLSEHTVFVTSSAYKAYKAGTLANYLARQPGQAIVAAPAGGASPAEPCCGEPGGYWTVLTSTHDEQGHLVPTRNGDSTIGFTKMVELHNLTDLTTVNDVISGAGDIIGEAGTRYTYQAWVIGDDHPDTAVRVVGDQSHTTAKGTTPDGDPVGSITGYCVGYTLCPNYVNAF